MQRMRVPLRWMLPSTTWSTPSSLLTVFSGRSRSRASSAETRATTLRLATRPSVSISWSARPTEKVVSSAWLDTLLNGRIAIVRRDDVRVAVDDRALNCGM